MRAQIFNTMKGALIREALSFFSIGIAVLLLCVLIDRFLGYKVILELTLERPGNFQLFYSPDDQFNEENSVRYWREAVRAQRVALIVPSAQLGYLRIDPMEERGASVVNKIIINRAFSSVTIEASRLKDHLQPLQMVEDIEVISSGLRLKSTGIDPVVVLDLRGLVPPYFDCFSLLLVAFIVLMLAAAVSPRVAPVYKRNIALLLISTVFTIFIVKVFYPGFMTYDSLHALRGARGGVTESIWPPMVSYIWRVVDHFSSNPSAMHGFQVFLLVLSLSFVLLFFVKRISILLVFLTLYFMTPVVLGTVSVIWKDVLMAALLFAGLACAIIGRYSSQRYFQRLFFILALLFIFLGVCARHNAITAAIPVLLYVSWSVCAKNGNGYFSARVWCVWLVMVVGVYSGKSLVDRYSIPEGHELKGATSLMSVVRVMDIAGASVCVGENLIADLAPELSLEDIERFYDPRHSNNSMGLFDAVAIDERLMSRWVEVATSHPACFWYNKLQLAKYMVGGNSGEQFLVAAPQIDENEFGYMLSPSWARDQMVSYTLNSSEFIVFRPWFIYMIALLAFCWAAFVNRVRHEHLILYSSAILYAGGLFMFGNAADARLLFYTNTIFLLAPFSLVFLKESYQSDAS
jgi:hypothetical protein